MRFCFIAVFFSIFIGSGAPVNAVPKSTLTQSDSKDLNALAASLSLPLEDRLRIIKKRGPDVLPLLEQMVFSSEWNINQRWRALTIAGRSFPQKSMGLIQQATQSSEWFLRNSAAIALAYGPKPWSEDLCIKLLDDAALVVRAAAAKSLMQLKSKKARPILWEKLYASENFKNGQSLWVRKNIAQALGVVASSQDTARFIKMLTDKDVRLHKPAVTALENITPRGVFSSVRAPGYLRKPHNHIGLKERQRIWLAWWDQQKKLELE